MNLYQITQEAQYLAALLETEELTPELEAELLINQEQLQSKGINYAKVIAKPNEYRQSYFMIPPFKEDRCEMYWGDLQTDIWQQLKDIVKKKD